MSVAEKTFHQKCWEQSDINEHLPTLKALAMQCSHVTEFGVRAVVSTWAFIAAEPDTVISVDIDNPSKYHVNLQKVEDAAKEVGVDFKFIQADTREIEIEPTDMLFIDTWHVYEQLKTELERHASKVRQFIVMHDTTSFGMAGESSGHKGLMPAIYDFLVTTEEGHKWYIASKYDNNNGLTILKRNP